MKKKKFIIFFLWSYSSWKRKKMCEKKNKNKNKMCRRSLAGLLPILALGHDTVHCIVTGMAGVCSRVFTSGQEALRHGPTTRPDEATTRRGRVTIRPTTRQACARGMWQRAHVHSLARGSRDTKHCIVAEGRPSSRNMAQQGCDTTLRHDNSVLRHDLRYCRARA